MENSDTGLLLDKHNIGLQRFYFEELVRLKGINLVYRAPRENKSYNGYGELDSFFYDPIVVGCIFDEHPNQPTMKKLGWVSELQDDVSIVHVPYNTPRLQSGALFIIPSGIDKAEGRLFRVTRMSTICMYPASVACQLAPVWKNTFEDSQLNPADNNFNLLKRDEEDM